MNKLVFLLVLLAAATPGYAGPAGAPHQIGGFVLGEDVHQYADRVRMDTRMPVRHREYLAEVEIVPFKGVRSGYVTFGTCKDPGKIVKIRLKYSNPGKGFYRVLLERYTRKFGEPNEWRGNPFHTLMAWKWAFEDEAGNRINLQLQHYSGEEDEYTSGNSVRLTLLTLMEEQRVCYQEKHPEEPRGAGPVKMKGESGLSESDMEHLVPR